MSKKKIFIGIAVLVVVLIVFIINIRKGGGDELIVQSANAAKEKVVQTVNATGKIQPEIQVKISADISAKIIKLAIEEGDWVEKGDLLVQLDGARFTATVERATANMRSTESNARLVKENMLKTKKDYERAKELFEKNLESQAILDQAYSSYEVEKARFQSSLDQVAQSQAALKEANDALSKTIIYAPMAGTISELNKEEGEIALGSQFQEDVIMIVSNLAGMEALVDVDENDIVNVSIGDSAKVEVDALPDVVFDGIVTEIANSAKITGQGTADQKTEFEVKIFVLKPGTRLRPGMTASADVITETKHNALAIPIQSVTVRTMAQLKPAEQDSGGDEAIADEFSNDAYRPDKEGFVELVWVVEDGKVKAKQVKTGIQSETHIEILEGLNENDEVVTGSYRAISKDLANGKEVTVDNSEGFEKEST